MKFALSALVLYTTAQQVYDPKEIREFVDQAPITCSSAIRLQNLASRYYLHSLEVGYG